MWCYVNYYKLSINLANIFKGSYKLYLKLYIINCTLLIDCIQQYYNLLLYLWKGAKISVNCLYANMTYRSILYNLFINIYTKYYILLDYFYNYVN